MPHTATVAEPPAETPAGAPCTPRPANPRRTRPPVAWDDPRPTVSIEQACTKAGVSRRTIYNWWAAGKVDWKRTTGGALRIVEASLWAGQARDPIAQAPHVETDR